MSTDSQPEDIGGDITLNDFVAGVLAASLSGEHFALPEDDALHEEAYTVMWRDALIDRAHDINELTITHAGIQYLGNPGEYSDAERSFLVCIDDLGARAAIRRALLALIAGLEEAVAQGAGAEFVRSNFVAHGGPPVDDVIAVRFVGAAHALLVRGYLCGRLDSAMNMAASESEGAILAAAMLLAWDELRGREDLSSASALSGIASALPILTPAGIALVAERLGDEQVDEICARQSLGGLWGVRRKLSITRDWFCRLNLSAPPAGGVTPCREA
ncbi:MAG: hypothetical protein ACKORG_06930 [Actinomycetota bacterium]